MGVGVWGLGVCGCVCVCWATFCPKKIIHGPHLTPWNPLDSTQTNPDTSMAWAKFASWRRSKSSAGEDFHLRPCPARFLHRPGEWEHLSEKRTSKQTAQKQDVRSLEARASYLDFQKRALLVVVAEWLYTLSSPSGVVARG